MTLALPPSACTLAPDYVQQFEIARKRARLYREQKRMHDWLAHPELFHWLRLGISDAIAEEVLILKELEELDNDSNNRNAASGESPARGNDLGDSAIGKSPAEFEPYGDIRS